MAVKRIVVDASVALKWFHPEERSEQAAQILKSIVRRDMVAFTPDLLLYEVANVWVRGMGENATEIPQIIDALQNLPWIMVTPSSELLAEAATFAKQHRAVSVYDAVYVALAMQEIAHVITADDRLYRQVGTPLCQLL